MTRFLFSDNCGFLDIGHPLWLEDGSVIYLYNCFWALQEQSLSDHSPAELKTIFYCLIWESLNLEGQVLVFISSRNRVTQLYPRALGSLFVASCDSQGYLRFRYCNPREPNPATTRSRSPSYFTTDGQPVSMSRCQAHSGTCDHILLPVGRLLYESCGLVSVGCCMKVAVSFQWGALSDERTSLQFAVQWLNSPSRAEPVTIFYCLVWDSPKNYYSSLHSPSTNHTEKISSTTACSLIAGGNVSTEMFPSNGCSHVGCLHGCYMTMGLYVTITKERWACNVHGR
jgi:hypothetical protein